ncbi:NAD(P)H-dependent oxidoreductase [Isoptericola sp. NEAU-Y5]|uniref:NAD(P)H-dependent oxidoreductase n=1 Tax=Isoptericola luteus TaxID=2879484 RepID=A0ABS7ZFA4_9MICO|nr:NAD(P)H-dependent oxidoreductase [Isoptericola sp. NEAU-Y5]MCA5893708.1 NAD(P)H-dependent oxidoreductase [Isoptericola sp. NEAU-Y5]
MKVLWVLAHPEPRSLTANLRDDGVAALRAGGHQVVQSDLYAMGWNPVVTAADFGEPDDGAFEGLPDELPTDRLDVAAASERALRAGTLAPDIRAEHDKLAWADTVVLQFPLWWHGPPAILKGWLDRVLVQGFAYGVRDPGSGRTLRYGDGGLAGRRALAVVTVGAGNGVGPRGLHGDLTEVLFGLLHGTFWYTGMRVADPVLVLGANRMDDGGYAQAARTLRARLAGLEDGPWVEYRTHESGDYDRNDELRADLAPGRSGLGVHRTDTAVTDTWPSETPASAAHQVPVR